MDESSAEFAIASVLVFGACGCTLTAIDCSRMAYDTRTMQLYGGVSECRRAWRRYNYQRDHPVWIKDFMGFDFFLFGGLVPSWLVWEGQVAEQVAYASLRSTVMTESFIPQSGGVVTDEGMDECRHSFHGVYVAQMADVSLAVGLTSQVASWLQQVGRTAYAFLAAPRIPCTASPFSILQRVCTRFRRLPPSRKHVFLLRFRCHQRTKPQSIAHLSLGVCVDALHWWRSGRLACTSGQALVSPGWSTIGRRRH